MISLQTQVSLKTLNTFGVSATAGYFVHVESIAQLMALTQHPIWQTTPRLILGGGSNVLFVQDFSGLVVHVALQGRRLIAEESDAWLVRIAAGENWSALVSWTLAQGWPGLENLSLIPGSVGAAPVQNIGAYGVELGERIAEVEVFDTQQSKLISLAAQTCCFAYRDSIFKQAQHKQRYIITAVTLRLAKRWVPILDYGDLRASLAKQGIDQPSPQQIADAVIAIRRAKLPDPSQLGNAGSFFKNPIVSAQQEQALRRRFPELVSYAQSDGRFKLAAAWLIDQRGWKGRHWQDTPAAVHDRQALVLVNHGNAQGAQIFALAQAIQQDIAASFDVHLEIEPTIVSCRTMLNVPP